MAHLALFLPFSCNVRRQVGASASRQNKLEVIEYTRKIGAYRESATTANPYKMGLSQGSGPGGLYVNVKQRPAASSERIDAIRPANIGN